VLQGKVALLTGANSGIGRELALGFAAAGAGLVLASRRRQPLEEVAAAAAELGAEVLAVPTDVTQAAAVDRLMAAAQTRFGGIDIVVCNAGGNALRGPVAGSDPAGWIAVMGLNVTAAYLTARAAIPLLRARGGGRIIMTGSGMGHRGSPGHSAYCCGKAAQWMLVRCLAQELVEDNISVNELIPGPVITPATLREREEDGFPSAFSIPGEWVKQAADVVPLGLFLASCPPPGPTAQSFSLMRRQG